MKELTIEEKAQRYDEALGRAKEIHTEERAQPFDVMLKVFPELKESEDERIRKWLIHYFKEVCDNVSEKEKKGIVAWLEKRPKDSPVLSNSSNTGKIEQKPAWSEEDEKKLNYLIALLQNSTMTNVALSATNEGIEDFLKSLKNRVQPQPKQEWGEEDERKINRIYSILGQAADTHAFSTTCRLIGDKECIELQDFLKSLKDRYTWKPSSEQIEAIRLARSFVVDDFSEKPTLSDILVELEKQLKKL